MKKRIKDLFFLVLFCLPVSLLIAQNQEDYLLNWTDFDWHVEDQGYNLKTSHQNIILDVYFGNLPVSAKMLISLNSPQSILYDYVFEDLSYRSSSIRGKTKTVQGAGNSESYFLNEIDITAGDELLGIENLRIFPTKKEERKNDFQGILGFGMFHRDKKILVIDNVFNRLAVADALPAYMEENTRFVPMQVLNGFITIPLRFDDKEIMAFFDGTSRPAMVVYHSGTFKKLSTDQAAADKLALPEGNFDVKLIEGFKPGGIIYFADLPLKNHDIYLDKMKQPDKVRASLSHAFFLDYVMVFDYKNGRFGIMETKFLSDIQKKK
ncbi:MAG: hypothetical protein ACLFQS_04755 [Bacteroidales bacterium]